MSMRRVIKNFLWIAGLMFSLQASLASVFIGTLGNGGDAWQTAVDGFNPLNLLPLNPYGFGDNLLVGPKNIGEEYRRNTPVMYYTFDENFTGFFGSNGTNAVIGAFNILNNLTNVSSYSPGLTEFPLQSESINYQAQALGLYDLKSLTLPILMEQLGIGDAIRYTWVLHSRAHFGNVACPVGEEYLVTERNFDINPSPLTQLLYSPYVNNALYSYSIYENCAAGGSPTPINAASISFPVDPLNDNPPVASGIGMGYLPLGGFYTGLTRDDVAGLRHLLQASNVKTESPAAGSLMQSTVVGTPTVLTTLDLNALLSASVTTPPAALVGLFPGLVVASSTSYFTNINGNFVQQFVTTFANVITNSYKSNSVVSLVTTTLAPPIGSPVGSPALTNTSTQTFVTNVASGDFYLLPTGTCGLNILQTGQTITNVTTTLISSSNNVTIQSVVTNFTHTFLVQVVTCPLVAPPTGKYEGIENIKFVGIDASQYDSLTGQFITPITNNYTMSVVSNGVVTIQNFQRVVTAPDFLFSAADQTSLGLVQNLFTRTTPNFNQANILPGLAGPGTIDPSTTTITLNKSGPVFVNAQTAFLNGPNFGSGFVYASFDGRTNPPVVYPNGTSIADLEAEVFINISPATLPVATHGSTYGTSFSVAGGQPPYTWSLATNSPVLPAGLTLSAAGLISGTPTQIGVFDFTIQLNDSASHTVRRNYSITIN
jgi:hypothetical protein